jgi:endonuclease-3 related protein
MSSKTSKILSEIYEKMFAHFGPQHWWPGETPFEVIVGAILTQNTNWGNVEKAIANLKKNVALNPQALEKIPPQKLAELIRPAGYFNVKAKRLKNFLRFLMDEYGGSVEALCREEQKTLREKLLGVKGIGPETADSILLYAAGKPSFVIDQYTYRLLTRHYLIEEESDYNTMQEFMVRHIREDVTFYNEFHAQIVMVGKNFCKKRPSCEKCPLKGVNW